MKEIKLNTSYSQKIRVDETMLASQVGSGIVQVYATPMLITHMENTALKCLYEFLDQGETSVGIMINTSHDAPTPVGMQVEICATIIAVDRKKITFEILAKDDVEVIGKATHMRYIVDKAKFESKAKQKIYKLDM